MLLLALFGACRATPETQESPMTPISLSATVAVVHMDSGRSSPFIARTSPKLPIRDSDLILISANSTGAKQILVLTDEQNTWRVLAVQDGDTVGKTSTYKITGTPKHIWVAATNTPSSLTLGQVLHCPQEAGCKFTQKLISALPPMKRTSQRPKTGTVTFEGRSARGIVTSHSGEGFISTRVDLIPR